MKEWIESQAHKDLIEQAVREDKLIHAPYHDIHFRPEELLKNWQEGFFRWGVENFRLVDKTVVLTDLKREIERAKKEIERITKE